MPILEISELFFDGYLTLSYGINVIHDTLFFDSIDKLSVLFGSNLFFKVALTFPDSTLQCLYVGSEALCLAQPIFHRTQTCRVFFTLRVYQSLYHAIEFISLLIHLANRTRNQAFVLCTLQQFDSCFPESASELQSFGISAPIFYLFP